MTVQPRYRVAGPLPLKSHNQLTESHAGKSSE
jgi:hypothetical protein